ncbi:MAG: serine--tRNA ligase, partial [Oscillospiraceae bacterium]
DNQLLRSWGSETLFPYPPKAHWEIGRDLGILDFERAQKVAGSRFTFYKGAAAKLERSLINYFLNTHTENGYTEIIPPFMVNGASMRGTAQLPKFFDDMYKICNEDYFLIPTAEVPVTNLYRDEILAGDRLPLRYCAYSPCFRNESHSAGRDTRGLIRQHQFNKVELVRFCSPEDSYNQLEQVLADAEGVLKGLELPYRIMKLCTGDLGFAAAKTYDIEVWMPSYNRYVEISSCSNYEDFQARRLNCKFKNQKGEKAQLLHTVNGSGVAVGRAVAAILENYQNGDGTVTVPKVLVGLMGCPRIGKENECLSL